MSCKSKGWKEGNVFEIIVDDDDQFSIGSIVILSHDDQSDCPLFDLLLGKCNNNLGVNTRKGAYMNLSEVKRIYPPENTVTIEIEGQKTEISLESAKALKKVLEGI